MVFAPTVVVAESIANGPLAELPTSMRAVNPDPKVGVVTVSCESLTERPASRTSPRPSLSLPQSCVL